VNTASIRRSVVALLACVLVACAPAPPVPEPLLNSERILQRYGSYGVDVLQQDGDLRVACLYSEEIAGRLCRTVAVTLFDPPPAQLQQALERIRAGASLGATLKASGWQVIKRDHHLVTRPTGNAFASLIGWSPDQTPPWVAVDAYALWVVRSGQSFRFARVAEAYHPDYLDLPGLRALTSRGSLAPGGLDVDWPDLDRALSDVLASDAHRGG